MRSPLIEAGQVFAAPASPSPRETPPHHDPNEESPESRRLFGAGLGRGAPTYSRRKAWQSQYVHAKTHSAAPPTPSPAFPFVLRRDRHKETYRPEVNRQSSITISTIRERATGDLDPRRNRNATSRKPFCLALCGKQQACSSAKHSNRNVRQA